MSQQFGLAAHAQVINGSAPAGAFWWGWDYPFVALSMARLGFEPLGVVEMLLLDTRYLPSGHNFAGFYPCDLSGNGGTLNAIAMMAAGTRSSPQTQGRFPAEWGEVRVEGFFPYP